MFIGDRAKQPVPLKSPFAYMRTAPRPKTIPRQISICRGFYVCNKLELSSFVEIIRPPYVKSASSQRAKTQNFIRACASYRYRCCLLLF